MRAWSFQGQRNIRIKLFLKLLYYLKKNTLNSEAFTRHLYLDKQHILVPLFKIDPRQSYENVETARRK